MKGRLRILYVDDAAVQRDMFSHSLSDGEYDVVTAVDTLDAVRVAQEGAFDIVVIDYHLGENEKGDTCLTALKADGRAQGTRYFLYTTDHDAFRRHRDMGFDGVLMLKGKTPVRSQIDVIARALRRTAIG